MHFRSSLGQFPNCHIISLNVGDGTEIRYKRGFNAMFSTYQVKEDFEKKTEPIFCSGGDF